MIDAAEIRARAARHKVPPQLLCTTCGQAAYTASHFGHPVTRLPSRAPRPVIEWLTVLDVALALGMSKMTVYRAIHAGDLPAVRIGKSFRVRRESLDAFLAGAEVVVASE